MGDRLDFFALAARRKLGVGGEWQISRIEHIGDDAHIFGGVPRTVKAGPKKGETSWRAVRLLDVVVTRGELHKARVLYERRTGKCYVCQGAKVETWGWFADGGEQVCECRRCGGTGVSKREVG